MNQVVVESPLNGRFFQIVLGAMILSAAFSLVMAIGQPRPAFPPMPDFSTYQQVDDKKAAFFDYLAPIVEFYNAQILIERKRLKRISATLAKGETLSWVDYTWLERLANKYSVEWSQDGLDSVVSVLKRRVDIVPTPLVLIQAAKESSWGESRFAVEANNLFGQQCFDEGCGLEPEQRSPGAKHEVQRFDTVSDAVRSYIRNLNTHDGYLKLRLIRQRLRDKNQPITAKALAEGLSQYSERREAYVTELKAMLAQYQRFQRARAE
jgi:Bax protein